MSTQLHVLLVILVVLLSYQVFAQHDESPDDVPKSSSRRSENSKSKISFPVFAQYDKSPDDVPKSSSRRSENSKYEKSFPVFAQYDEVPDDVPKSSPRRSENGKSEKSFPDCGLRSPKIKGSGKRNFDTRHSNTRSDKRSSLSDTGEKRNAKHEFLLHEGNEANQNSWPWMAALVETANPGKIFCGASLISQKFVLTAAHCMALTDERSNFIRFLKASEISVFVGSHTTNDGVEHHVRKILLHPGYKQGRVHDDICLLEMKKNVELSEKVYPVCLPSSRDNILRSGTVTGWGEMEDGQYSKILREISIPIVPLKKCKEIYPPGLGLPRGITNKMFCAGDDKGQKDACQGDSGGPYVAKLEDNSYMQLGIVSFGSGCAEPGIPGVYTRVSQYTKWIYDNTDLKKTPKHYSENNERIL